MRTINTLVLGEDDLIDPQAGYAWGNLTDRASNKAVYANVVIFDGRVVKDYKGETRRGYVDNSARHALGEYEYKQLIQLVMPAIM